MCRVTADQFCSDDSVCGVFKISKYKLYTNKKRLCFVVLHLLKHNILPNIPENPEQVSEP